MFPYSCGTRGECLTLARHKGDWSQSGLPGTGRAGMSWRKSHVVRLGWTRGLSLPSAAFPGRGWSQAPPGGTRQQAGKENVFAMRVVWSGPIACLHPPWWSRLHRQAAVLGLVGPHPRCSVTPTVGYPRSACATLPTLEAGDSYIFVQTLKSKVAEPLLRRQTSLVRAGVPLPCTALRHLSPHG